jgi:hypothetical protein
MTDASDARFKQELKFVYPTLSDKLRDEALTIHNTPDTEIEKIEQAIANGDKKTLDDYSQISEGLGLLIRNYKSGNNSAVSSFYRDQLIIAQAIELHNQKATGENQKYVPHQAYGPPENTIQTIQNLDSKLDLAKLQQIQASLDKSKPVSLAQVQPVKRPHR